MKRSILIFLLLLNTSARGIVILVHGTFARESKWYCPGGDFFEAIEKRALEKKQFVIPFVWSGKFKDAARLRAAHILSRIILSYPGHEEIILIGHSHGGNVINLASQLLHQAQIKSNPYAQQEKSQTQWIISKKVNRDKYEKIVHDLAELYKLNWSRSYGLYHTVKEAYLIATPVDELSYAPNSHIIKSVYNFYSKKDYVQQVFGMYDQWFRTHPGVTNFCVSYQNSKTGEIYNPGHRQLHRERIARWLFEVPSVLQEFEGEKRRPLEILFYKDRKPVITGTTG